jgi:hypothetical protein
LIVSALAVAAGALGVAREALRADAAVERTSFLRPFPPGSLWNTPLPRRPAVDPRSGEKIGYWLSQIRHPNMVLRAYATAIAIARPGSARYRIACTVHPCPNLHRYGRVPIPAGTRADVDSDGHLAIWDPVKRREWDLWMSKCPEACGQAGTGGAFSTKTLVPNVRYSANAAGFPLLAGIVHPEEIRAGRIDHPLVFAAPNVGKGRVCPARHDDGDNPDPRALKEGTLLQLDPGIRVSSLPIAEWERTIARALQQYGMYLVDQGGTLSIGAENPINRGDLWAQLGLVGNSAMFSTAFPWSSMRVLTPRKRWCKRANAGHN